MVIKKSSKKRLFTAVLIEDDNQKCIVQVDVLLNNGKIEYLEHFSTIREDIEHYLEYFPESFSEGVDTYEADNKELLDRIDNMRTKEFSDLIQKII